MSPRRLLAVASLLLLAGAVHFFFLRPSRRRGRLEAVAQAEQKLACCTRGARIELCKESLGDLLELSSGKDRVAGDASVFRATCPAANEFDPERPHPPEQVLCGFTATEEAREGAAAALVRLRPDALRVLLAGPCTEEGMKAAVPVLAQEFEAACGDSACLDFFLSGHADPAQRPLVYAHSHKIAVALLARLAQVAGRGNSEALPKPAAVKQLLGWAAGADALGEPLALVVNGGPGSPLTFELLLRGKPSPVLLSLLKTIAESTGSRTGASRRAGLVRFALGEVELDAPEEAAAIDEVDCTLLPALLPKLRLDEAPRADAALRTPLRCPEQGLGLLANPLQFELTTRVVAGNWKLLQGHTAAQLRFEPAARRLMHALLQQQSPPPAGVRLSSEVLIRSDELALSVRPLLRSGNSSVRAAAAAALATTLEEIPRDAALACAREQQAWLQCAITGSTWCGLVCGGAPLSGLERARIAEAARVQVPDPSMATVSNQR